MSACNSCTETKTLWLCAGTLQIGTIASISTAVFVWIHNHTTGRVDRVAATSSLAGVVSLASGAYPWMEYHDYEVWITTQADVNTRVAITLGGQSPTCLALKFRRVQLSDAVTTTNQTIALA